MAAILSGIIIKGNLEPFLINYLFRKVGVLFHFLLGHNILGTELTAGLCVCVCVFVCVVWCAVCGCGCVCVCVCGWVYVVWCAVCGCGCV